ncbi:MAG: 50S ribosomal protein L20 [Patescibacteria group bacterium]|nr:50S ribosomal protein L20 [Patescibacteria group bacterium]
MPRVKRAVIHLKKRRALMRAVKGYRWGRKNIIRLARPAMLKAGAYAYRDRRNKKRAARALWQIKINAACRANGLSYSAFMGKLGKQKIALDRKILALLAEHHPAVFAKIVEKVK